MALPHLPPLTAFFAGAETYYYKFKGGGGILRGGAYAASVLKQGVHMHPLPYGSARLWGGGGEIFNLKIMY